MIWIFVGVCAFYAVCLVGGALLGEWDANGKYDDL